MPRVALALALLVAPSVARAECRASASGGYSFDLRVSPRAGGLCLMIADVHEGASCAGEPAWSVELGCNATSRIAITDHGRLVSILAPRASRDGWDIVQVTTRDGPPARIPLRRLRGGLRGAVALELDGAAILLRTRAGDEERVTFDALETLAATRSPRASAGDGAP